MVFLLSRVGCEKTMTWRYRLITDCSWEPRLIFAYLKVMKLNGRFCLADGPLPNDFIAKGGWIRTKARWLPNDHVGFPWLNQRLAPPSFHHSTQHTMGGCVSTVDRAGKERSDMIDKEIEDHSKRFKRECKILLLGKLLSCLSPFVTVC